MNDGVGDGKTASDYAQKVENTRINDRKTRFHRLGIDHGRDCIGDIMEAIDKLKGEHEAHGQRKGDGDVGLNPRKQIQHDGVCTQCPKGRIVVSKTNAVKYLK